MADAIRTRPPRRPPPGPSIARATARATEVAALGLESAAASSFAFVELRSHSEYAFHTHRRHQLLYATRGTARLEVSDARYLLPPQRIAFIPAGLPHATAVGDAEIVSVYFRPALVPGAPTRICISDVTPLLREMVVYATRWRASRRPRDRVANAYFAAFGLLLPSWLEDRASYRLPRGESREVRRAIELVLADPSAADAEAIARAVGTSSRTLRRRFEEELGVTLRELVVQARILASMELLLDADASVASVAYEVGFESVSAFTRAFGRVVGATPSAFRGRAAPPRS